MYEAALAQDAVQVVAVALELGAPVNLPAPAAASAAGDHAAGGDIAAVLREPPLTTAVRGGAARVVRLLLERGADATVVGGEVRTEPAPRGRAISQCALCCPRPASPQEHMTPLQLACARRHPGVVRALCAAGADPNATGPDGAPLLAVGYQGDSEAVGCMQALYEAGARIVRGSPGFEVRSVAA